MVFIRKNFFFFSFSKLKFKKYKLILIILCSSFHTRDEYSENNTRMTSFLRVSVLDVLIAEDTTDLPTTPYFFTQSAHALKWTPKIIAWSQADSAFLITSSIYCASWAGVALLITFSNSISPTIKLPLIIGYLLK